MRLDIYQPPLTMADDPRLVEVFMPLRKRLWWERINWPFVKGACIAVAISALLWTGIVYFFLWAVRGL